MGSQIEINDTLNITAEQGFPAEVLDLEKHRDNPVQLEDVTNKIFEFQKSGKRVFHPSPVRCFLVQNIDGKWLYWGHIEITEQTIKGDTTSGKYKILKIYAPEYQKLATENESPKGKSYFE